MANTSLKEGQVLYTARIFVCPLFIRCTRCISLDSNGKPACGGDLDSSDYPTPRRRVLDYALVLAGDDGDEVTSTFTRNDDGCPRTTVTITSLKEPGKKLFQISEGRIIINHPLSLDD